MKVDDFYVQNSKDYKPPQYVEKLPPKQPIGGGEAVTIDEVKFLSNTKQKNVIIKIKNNSIFFLKLNKKLIFT